MEISRKRAKAQRGFGWIVALVVIPLAVAAQTPEKEEKKPVVPLKLGARAYFVAHCQRCHGVDGSNYTPQFAKDKTLEKLKFDIDRMANGPGGQALKPEEMDAQVAYHQLISAGKPFVDWTGKDGLVLKGEFADGAKLASNIGTLKVDEDEDLWTLTLPSEADLAKVKLTATLEKQETVFVPSESAFAKLPKEKVPNP